MNTQNTPIHVRLWHRDFWLLSLASLLLTMSVYVLVPSFPVWLLETEKLSAAEVGISMAAFAIGLYGFGIFCSWLVQRFRRNNVCILSIATLIGSLSILYYIHGLRSEFVEFWLVVIQRLLLGATFGLAQMVLLSTLVIDALSLGPIVGYVLFYYKNFDAVLLASLFCAACSIILILAVNFPFRTPSDTFHIVSLDRFFLPQSLPLYFNLMLFAIVVGMLMSLGLSDRFYACIMAGFLLALVAQRVVFPDAELKSEIVTGFILMLMVLILIFTRPLPIVWYVAPLLLGLSIGVVCSRFLLFFIKLSRHCQRGTSQSMYFLGWESGVALGLGIGYGFFFNDDKGNLITCMVLTAVALLSYNYYTHKWFLKNKNR